MLFALLPAAFAADAKIINGDAAATEDYPMAGGMLMDTTVDFGSWGTQDMRMFVCSSTLIAPDVVLLAAHCIDEYSFTYGFGEMLDTDIRWTREADLTDWDGTKGAVPWPDDTVKAWDWVAHPDFDMESFQTGIAENEDIALLFLDEAVLDVDYAYLPQPGEEAQVVEGLEVVVVGWGQQIATGWGESPPAGSYAIKQQGVSTIVELGSHEFKVGELESDVRKCHGDSGGPSFATLDVDTANTMRLVGVTSHAYDNSDCNETGGVDTRVDAYLTWIDSEMRSRCEDGSRAWCDQEGIPEPNFEVEPLDSGDTGEEGGGEGPKACGCASTTPAPVGLAMLALVGLVALRRRR